MAAAGTDVVATTQHHLSAVMMRGSAGASNILVASWREVPVSVAVATASAARTAGHHSLPTFQSEIRRRGEIRHAALYRRQIDVARISGPLALNLLSINSFISPSGSLPLSNRHCCDFTLSECGSEPLSLATSVTKSPLQTMMPRIVACDDVVFDNHPVS